MAILFDMELRAARRDRAKAIGPDLFLLERAFEDCLDRLSLIQQRFEHALLLGCPDPSWPSRLLTFAKQVDVLDPGAMFSRAANGRQIMEDRWEPEPARYGLVLAIGTLDTVNDLPRALIAIRFGMKPDGLLIGAMSGGNTLPRLRSAMRAADAVLGAASPHVHPRIEAAALAPLLQQAGFANPVVDVDRIAVSYRSLGKLVSDLRRMGATNILHGRSRQPLSRRVFAAAAADFASASHDGRTEEVYEILHFAGWAKPFGPE
jgi:NADH dehydrogenase [ubiquinone] 1 alpha subcomplex assembly factor 5